MMTMPYDDSIKELDDVLNLSQPLRNDATFPQSKTVGNSSLSQIPPLTGETSDPAEANDQNEIIHSPLDQRAYKSITLGNGVRIMLISTYDVETYADEQDATKTPCQVPEVSKFNRTYLGYDNPAAKVKCACPCDEQKKCCCKKARTLKPKGCKNTLNRMESIRAACCKNYVESDTKIEENPLPVEPVLSKENPVEFPEKPETLAAYQQKIFRKLKQKELFLKEKNRKPTHIYDDDKEKTILAGSLSQEFSVNGNVKCLRNTHLRNYPNPPKYTEGLNKMHSLPIEAPRKGNTRPGFADDFLQELEGTVNLVIGSGYYDDPEEAPGLAHFCEHAVFLGSSKFPEPNQLFKLVLPYSGFVNAYTSGMMTSFMVASTYQLFPLAVEMLGDMVGFPSFPNALVAAELEALDSEYSLRQDDMPKYFQLIGSLAKKGHVMRKMDSGNINTLTVPNFYRKLVEWRKIYYNPNRMTLAVEAPFPLDYLEALVTESFGKIPIPNATPIPLLANRHLLLNGPFDMKKFHQIYQVPSVYHSEFLALHWALDCKAWKNLNVKPLEYLGSIISHKAEGGLYHYLTTHGLATSVDAGCWESDLTRNHFTSVFCISVDMTERGFQRQDNILQAIFGYIEMLIRNKPQKSFFQELQKQQLDSFHYLAAESNLTMVEGISRWLQFIPPKWCLISPSLTTYFDESLIQKYTESLTIDTANVIIFSKHYRGLEQTSRDMEEFYNTPFAAYYFPDELTDKIKRTNEEYSRNFVLPPKNPLLLNTACCRAREKDLLQKGKLLKIKGKLSVSYVSRKVRMVRGLLPQARYSIWIGSPVASYVEAEEGSSSKLLMWSQYLNTLLATKLYHASSADIQLETEVCQGELHIVLAGASTALPPLIEKILDIFNNFENIADETGFEVVRTSCVEKIDNVILDNRFLAWDVFHYLWTSNHELIFDYKRNGERMKFNSFKKFVKNFKAKMYIQTHLYGYVTKAQGKIILNALEKLEYSPVELRQYLVYRCVKLPLGERIVRVNSQNPNVHTSVLINCYQFGILSEAEEDVVMFFAKTMSDSAFYQLRTEQQLGYIIIIYPELTYGVSSIVVELVTQPKNFTTEYCNECIDKFLMDFYTENLSTPETFMEFSMGKPKLDLSFQTIKNFFAAHLLPNPNSYRKLSIQIVGEGEAQDAASTPTKSTETDKPNPHQPNYPKQVTRTQIELDRLEHTVKLSDAERVAAARRSDIEQIRMLRNSLHQLSVATREKHMPPLNKARVTSKVVGNVDKFRKSLMYYPNLKSQ